MNRDEDKRSSERTRILEQYIKTNYRGVIPEGRKKTIAREIVRIYPDLFDNDIEKARKSIRKMSGADGAKSRPNNPIFEKLKVEAPDNPVDISWQLPYIIPSGIKEMVIFGDTHGVYMDKMAVEDAIVASDGIKTLFINGDLLDNHWLGRWRKDNRSPMPQAEFDFVRRLLETFKKHFDTIYLKQGNHDAWLGRYVSDGAPALSGMQHLQLSAFLKLDELGIKTIHDLQVTKFGDLSILHGHEKPGYFTPVYVAQAVMKWWQNYEGRHDVKVLVNHHHIVDEDVKRGIDGSFGRAWVNGCLCTTHPTYNPYGRSQHGMAKVRQNNGVTTVELVRL